MKHIFIKYFLLFVAFSIPTLVHAQDPAIYDNYNIEGDVATAKSISGPDRNGFYTLTLETFATGEFMSATKAIPSDIVLVLDYSSSMLMNGSVGANPNNQWYNGTGSDGLPNVRDYLYSLKKAVGDFVKMMQDNNDKLNLAPGQTGNRIAVVLFAGKVYGSSQPNESGSGNFYARHLSEFIPVDQMEVVEKTERHPLYSAQHPLTYASAGVVYDDIDILSPSSYRGVGNKGYNGIDSGWDIGDVNKGTRTGDAMTEAARLVRLNTSSFPYTERSTTVVMFTDGEPSRGSGFSAEEANLAISQARGIKSATVNSQETDTHVKIFTVGLLNEPDATMKTYMEYVSSDFSPASEVESQQSSPNSLPSEANYLNPSNEYGPYSSIVSQGADLSKVFQTIAESSGGSSATIPAQTQVRDGVTSSFVVPGQSVFNDITVYTQTPTLDGTSWNPTHNTLTTVSADPDDVLTGPNAVEYIKEPNKVGLLIEDNKLTVLGFDYSKGDPDGNWVGWRDIEGDKKCYGRKLVIEFKVKADPNATGGDDTSTNTTDSGIYLPVFDDNGNIETYRKINSFEVQHADLPINLVIEKIGLRHGESATIQIYRAPQLVINGKVQYDPATGKPLPDEEHWENFSKVILTNKGADGQKVTKTLLCLFPEYVYKLEEDNWGWAYNLDTRSWDTSQKEKNPFQFVNTEKTGAVKHAEAVSINHFGQDESDKRTEYYKSSKVEYFSNPTNY